MNDPVREITLTENSDLKGLPQIKVYQAESGEYFFRDVEVITEALLRTRIRETALCLNSLDTMKFASVLIAVKVLSISQRARKI